MSVNPIIEKIIWQIQLRLEEPLCVSVGGSVATDMDVIKDFDGHPFIPGSSLAGAFRHYLEECGGDTCLFGEGSGDNSRMSPLFISDVTFDTEGNILEERDGVCLENKQAKDGGKFDMEIVKAGTSGSLELELNIRKNDGNGKGAVWEQQISLILSGLHSGEILLGAKKTRGFGKLSLTGIRRRTFSRDNLKEWLDYTPGDRSGFSSIDPDSLNTPGTEGAAKPELFASAVIPLELTGGISIRRYSAQTEEADYETLTMKTPDGTVNAVIPGSSWAGVIRSRAGEILTGLGVPEVTCLLREWFGYVDEVNHTARRSVVTVSESRIRGGEELDVVRNRIDRFSGGTVKGHLYHERAYFRGTLSLSLRVRRSCPDWQAVCGLLILVIKDIENGYLPAGGQTAVGRGIFASAGRENRLFEGEEDGYLHALAEFVMERKNSYGMSDTL
ncbi:hypothetical protein B5F07_07765 [Lachnoclostridium sp. An169]|uniref:RAMP superfamily CRISPR-associated protein n=1 Tax=Lachnoclostridium sp. An169 TaxID=1965569 RepID=UPI000B391804|nr:RAMP superfamily CRISPR-associated protein [Lachnoclostridium sp. An169]OUP84351.1 hypothetical protein B5F07_07765 [Lachnoclostridium sp. An169]